MNDKPKYTKITVEDAVKAVSEGNIVFYEGIGKIKKPINNFLTRNFCKVLIKYNNKLYIKED